jgi:prophage regulatory protein
MNIDDHVTAAEAATILGIKRESVYSYAQRLPGFPQPVRIGRTLLWTKDALLSWRADHPARRT